METYVLAIDLGTSSVRAMIVDHKGTILSKAQTKYGVISISSYMQEQSAEDIYQYFVETAKMCTRQFQAKADKIQAIAFSSQMYNIFPIDKKGRALYPMLLWSDSRSEPQAARLAESKDRETLYKSTGCPLNSMYPLAKILWFQKEKAELTKKTWRYLSVKEYIVQKITGEYVIDESMASATGIFNIHTMQWDKQALGMLGIQKEQLSTPVSGLSCFRFANQELLKELGLSSEILVVLGGGDGPLAQIGSGAGKKGCINIDLGTSGAARILTQKAMIDKKQRMWTYAVTEHSWVYGGILSNVGNGYHWLIKNIAQFLEEKSIEKVFAMVEEKMAENPSIYQNLFFIPYLIRCRSPYWDDKIKATIYGLTQEHTFIDMVKAYLESIGFDLLSLIEIMEEQIEVPEEIILTGGLCTSEFICQLLADILGRKLVTLPSSEGSILGAAIFGLKALGVLEEWYFEKEIEVQNIYTPCMDTHSLYQKKYKNYQRLRNALHEIET